MGRHDLSSDDASAMICRRPQETNVNVPDLAPIILARRNPTEPDPTHKPGRLLLRGHH
jgi:hypothetical protein